MTANKLIYSQLYMYVYHITSHHITSHHIIAYHIISYPLQIKFTITFTIPACIFLPTCLPTEVWKKKAWWLLTATQKTCAQFLFGCSSHFLLNRPARRLEWDLKAFDFPLSTYKKAHMFVCQAHLKGFYISHLLLEPGIFPRIFREQQDCHLVSIKQQCHSL